MNYYIEGNAAKADQIKAAFEKLGYDISWSEGCANPDVINIGVERNGAKYVVAETSEYIKDIIKTHPDYQELELSVEPKFKVGDWVVKKSGYTFYGGNYVEQITLIDVDEDGERIWLSSTTWVENKDIRLWTIQDAKDGDVLADYADGLDNPLVFILKRFEHVNYGLAKPSDYSSYCFLKANARQDFLPGKYHHKHDIKPATKEQRGLLFSKMKEAGYEWDEKKKELRKIQPHYDIANFKPFDKVLIRVGNNSKWTCDFFSYYHNGCFHCVGTDDWNQCIPFEGNEHLLGTTDTPSEEFINW